MARLGLDNIDPNWSQWNDLLDRVHNPTKTVTIAMVGKYIDLPDAYLSVAEALRAGGFANRVKIDIRWVASDDCATEAGAKSALSGVDGICVPGGFGVRGIEGKLGALRYGRENKIPTLGLCLGLQCMVIEVARNLMGLPAANSLEFDATTEHPVIATMADQVAIVSGDGDLGASMRLGAYDAKLASGSLVRKLYGEELISERHRHRYEVNNKYRDAIVVAGLNISGTSPNGELVEFVEIDPNEHPFYVGTQAHPEFKSRPTRPHPLFVGFISAASQ
jgi:CTP synthase